MAKKKEVAKVDNGGLPAELADEIEQDAGDDYEVEPYVINCLIHKISLIKT